MTSNDFRELYKKISNTELLDILENQESYQQLAVDTAKIEFEKRKLSDQDITIAKEPIIAKQLAEEKQKDKAKGIEEKVKDLGNIFIDTLNPIQQEKPTGDNLIRIITLVFGGIFIYQIISNYRLLTFIFKDLSRLDFSILLYFPLFIILPIATFTFWKRKTIGWVMLSFFLTYSLVGVLWGLIESFTRKSSGLTVFENLYPRISPITFIIELFFLCGTLYVLCKQDIRKIFKIDNQKMKITILVSGVLTLLLTFMIS